MGKNKSKKNAIVENKVKSLLEYRVKTKYPSTGRGCEAGDYEWFCPLIDLWKHISVDCEVWELKEEDDEGIYLGRISRKAMEYIATEVADYCLENYNSPNLSIYDEESTYYAKTLIESCKKWVDDPSSISSAVISEKMAKAFRIHSSSYAPLRDAAISTAYSILHTDAICDSNYQQVSLNLLRYIKSKVIRNEEKIRQCQFVIDFLKSDKQLFMG
jgi:hypothetical protein